MSTHLLIVWAYPSRYHGNILNVTAGLLQSAKFKNQKFQLKFSLKPKTFSIIIFMKNLKSLLFLPLLFVFKLIHKTFLLSKVPFFSFLFFQIIHL